MFDFSSETLLNTALEKLKIIVIIYWIIVVMNEKS